MATQARYYSNVAVANTLGNTGGISNSADSIYMTVTPSGYPTQFPFVLELAPNGSINSGQAPEIVLVGSGAGTAASPWIITRAQDGTTAQSWSSGCLVQHTADAGDFTAAALHAGSVQEDLPHDLPNSAWLTAAWAALEETVVAEATPTINWDDIPQTYSHLLIVVQARCSESSVQSDDIACTVNGDAGAFYSYLTMIATNISGSGTVSLPAPTDYTANANTNWPLIRIAASLAGAAANAGGGFAFIPNYTSTYFNKMFVSLSGMGDGTTAAIDGRVRWGFYNPSSQAAISELALTAPGGSNFNVGSYFGLYGID